jgi:hypothetical protein
MILAYLLLLTGLTISAVAIYYSVVGLTAIFSAAAIPIIIMGSALEVGKLVCASWLKANWEKAPRFMKYYMVIAVVVLMLITSMGIFGFLSKAHNDQTLVSGDVGSKIAIYDEKIKTAKENIEADRKQLKQMDEAVDQIMGRSSDEKGADKANAVRKSQQRDRVALAKDIETNQKQIASLNDEAAPIRAEVRKVEAEVGPIKYIAAFIYGTAPDESMLERAVTWIIILIVVVFDPLAVIMLLAAQMTFGWAREQKDRTWIDDQADDLTEAFDTPNYPQDNGPLTDSQTAQIKETVTEFEGVREPGGEWIQTGPTFEVPITADSERSIPMTGESDLEKWNKMIEEAEKAAVPESTVEERVAKGETYIDGQGKEVALEKNTVTLSEVIANPEKFQPAVIEQKSKPTLLSDLSPTEESFTEASIEVVAENITVPESIDPNNFEIDFENTNSKKKTYMIKDSQGQIQTKSK